MLWHPDSFVSRESIFGLVGRRAGGSFFALHRDPKLTAIYRDWQKQGTVTLRFLSGQAPKAPNYCSAVLAIRRAVGGNCTLITNKELHENKL